MFSLLRFNGDGSVQELDCSPRASFQISHATGIMSNPTGKAQTATDSSPSLANVIIDMLTNRILRSCANLRSIVPCSLRLGPLYALSNLDFVSIGCFERGFSQHREGVPKGAVCIESL